MRLLIMHSPLAKSVSRFRINDPVYAFRIVYWRWIIPRPARVGTARYSPADVLHQSINHLINAVIHRFPVVQASGGGVTFWVTCLMTSTSSPASSCSLSITLIGPVARRPIPCLIMGNRICSSFIIWLESSSCSAVRYFVRPRGTFGLSA